MCEISESGWFYYKYICHDARSHERKVDRQTLLPNKDGSGETDIGISL